MITKSLFLLSSIVLTVFCLCCKDVEDPTFIPTLCDGELEFLPESPPPGGRAFEPISLAIDDDCLLTFISTTFCVGEDLRTNLFVVATADSLPQLFLRVSPDSTCASSVFVDEGFDLSALRTTADSVVLVFPEADTSLVYRY